MCGPGQQDADEHNAHWQAMNCIKVMNLSQDCLAGKEEKKRRERRGCTTTQLTERPKGKRKEEGALRDA